MLSRLIPLTVAIAVGALWLATDRLPVRADDVDRIAELEAKVETLQLEVAVLFQERKARQQTSPRRVTLQWTPDVSPVPGTAVPDRSLGGKYRPHGTINGLPYYVIPLNEASRAEPATPPASP